MAKSKIQCPDCCTYTITFTKENCQKILNAQGDLLKQGKRRSVEQVVNKLLGK